MKKFATLAALSLVVIEGVITAIPFLLAWWACSLYRSVLLGWTVSGMTSIEKRGALAQLLGHDENA